MIPYAIYPSPEQQSAAPVPSLPLLAADSHSSEGVLTCYPAADRHHLASPPFWPSFLQSFELPPPSSLRHRCSAVLRRGQLEVEVEAWRRPWLGELEMLYSHWVLMLPALPLLLPFAPQRPASCAPSRTCRRHSLAVVEQESHRWSGCASNRSRRRLRVAVACLSSSPLLFLKKAGRCTTIRELSRGTTQ